MVGTTGGKEGQSIRQPLLSNGLEGGGDRSLSSPRLFWLILGFTLLESCADHRCTSARVILPGLQNYSSASKPECVREFITGLAAGQRWSDHVAALWCMKTCSPHVVEQLNDAGLIRSRSTYYRCLDSRPHRVPDLDLH